MTKKPGKTRIDIDTAVDLRTCGHVPPVFGCRECIRLRNLGRSATQ